MNEQKPPNAIEWTRIRKVDGSYTKGWTWNVVGGCMHGCQWEMPNNMVPLCGGQNGCNNSKSDKKPHDWLIARYGKAKAKQIIDRVNAYFQWVNDHNLT